MWSKSLRNEIEGQGKYRIIVELMKETLSNKYMNRYKQTI